MSWKAEHRKVHLPAPRKAETPLGRTCPWLHHRAQVTHSRCWTWARTAWIHLLCYIGLTAIIAFQSNFLLIYSSNSWMTPIKSITNVVSLWMFALNTKPRKLLNQWLLFFFYETHAQEIYSVNRGVRILGFSNNTRCATTTTIPGKHSSRELY